MGPRPTDPRWVDVCDRGADVFEYLDHKHARGEFYLVRAAQDRRIEFEQDGVRQKGKLWASAASLPTLGEREVDVPARDGQPARKAKVRVAVGRFQLVPPRQPRGEHRKELLEVWVVDVRELAPPAGVEPLEWVLLSNVPTTTRAEAEERVRWYALRWLVDISHPHCTSSDNLYRGRRAG